MFQHIKDLVELDDSGPKAWKLLRDVIQPNTLPIVIVLEKELAALSMRPGDDVKPVLDKIKDTYARMAVAGSNVSQMQQCTKIISVLDNSWDNFIPTLNTQQDQWTPEWLRQQILQEDFRRRHTGSGAANKTAEGYGAPGGSRGRGEGEAEAVGEALAEGEAEVTTTKVMGALCFSRPEGWAPPGMKPPSGERARDGAVQGSGAQASGAQGKADPGMFLMVEDVKGSEDFLDEVKPPGKIKFVAAALGALLPVIGVGNAKMMGANEELAELGNVLLVEGLSADLLSVRRLQKSKAKVSFGPTSCRAKLGKLLLWDLEEKSSCIKDLWQLPIIPWNGKLPATAAAAATTKATMEGEKTAPTDGALDAVKKVKQPQQPHGEVLAGVDATAAWANASSGSGEADWETWHERLCHVNFPMLQKLVKDGSLKGLEVKGTAKEIGSCPTCLETKFTKFPFSSGTRPAKAPLALVHMDVVGPTRAPSLSGSHYFLTIVDDHTRAVWVYPLKMKGEVAAPILKGGLPDDCITITIVAFTIAIGFIRLLSPLSNHIRAPVSSLLPNTKCIISGGGTFPIFSSPSYSPSCGQLTLVNLSFQQAAGGVFFNVRTAVNASQCDFVGNTGPNIGGGVLRVCVAHVRVCVAHVSVCGAYVSVCGAGESAWAGTPLHTTPHHGINQQHSKSGNALSIASHPPDPPSPSSLSPTTSESFPITLQALPKRLFSDCSFISNTAPTLGGGAFSINSGKSMGQVLDLRFVRCSFQNNSTPTSLGVGDFGGGVRLTNADHPQSSWKVAFCDGAKPVGSIVPTLGWSVELNCPTRVDGAHAWVVGADQLPSQGSMVNGSHAFMVGADQVPSQMRGEADQGNGEEWARSWGGLLVAVGAVGAGRVEQWCGRMGGAQEGNAQRGEGGGQMGIARFLPCLARTPPCCLCATLPCSPRAAMPCSPRAALPCSLRAALPCSPCAALPCSPRHPASRVTLQPVRPAARIALLLASPCSPLTLQPTSPSCSRCPAAHMPCSPRRPAARVALQLARPAARVALLPASPSSLHALLPASPCCTRRPAARAPCCLRAPCPAARMPRSPAARALPCPTACAQPCSAARALPFPAARTPCSPRVSLLAQPCSPHAALPCSPRAALPTQPCSLRAALQPVRPAARARQPCSPHALPARRPTAHTVPCPAARADLPPVCLRCPCPAASPCPAVHAPYWPPQPLQQSLLLLQPQRPPLLLRLQLHQSLLTPLPRCY
ncbi:unnamed protein product [Closterium sp. NIES-53]